MVEIRVVVAGYNELGLSDWPRNSSDKIEKWELKRLAEELTTEKKKKLAWNVNQVDSISNKTLWL